MENNSMKIIYMTKDFFTVSENPYFRHEKGILVNQISYNWSNSMKIIKNKDFVLLIKYFFTFQKNPYLNIFRGKKL